MKRLDARADYTGNLWLDTLISIATTQGNIWWHVQIVWFTFNPRMKENHLTPRIQKKKKEERLNVSLAGTEWTLQFMDLKAMGSLNLETFKTLHVTCVYILKILTIGSGALGYWLTNCTKNCKSNYRKDNDIFQAFFILKVRSKILPGDSELLAKYHLATMAFEDTFLPNTTNLWYKTIIYHKHGIKVHICSHQRPPSLKSIRIYNGLLKVRAE